MKGGRDPLKVLVAGAGAIGQWLGLRLMQGGHDVTLLLRPAHAEAIHANGLRCTGATVAEAHPRCVTDARDAHGPFDAVVLTCKAHQTADVAKSVAPLLASDGVLATLQNGFGNAAKASRFAPPAQVACAITSHGVSVVRPGQLLHAGEGATLVGPGPAGLAAAPQRAFSLLDHAKLAPEWHDAMRGPVWRKALVNHAVNPVAAATGRTNGRLLEEPAWSEVRALVAEGYALARCAGVAMPGVRGEADLLGMARGTLERTAANTNSMLQDVQAGRRTEVEQISGRIVRLGRRLGIALPKSDEAYRAVKAIEARSLGEEAALAAVRDEVAWEGSYVDW